jgi:hypothetical protein
MSETSAKNGDRRDELQTSPASNKEIDNRTSSEGIPYFILHSLHRTWRERRK